MRLLPNVPSLKFAVRHVKQSLLVVRRDRSQSLSQQMLMTTMTSDFRCSLPLPHGQWSRSALVVPRSRFRKTKMMTETTSP